MENNRELLAECIAYFRERPVYGRLFGAVWEKYRSLGHLGGSVTLTGLAAEDARQLGGFLQKNYEGKRTVTVSARALEKALAGSRFGPLAWEEILQAYFGEALVSKSQQRQREQSEREAFFSEILENTGEHPGRAWLLDCLQQKSESGSLLMRQYRERPQELARALGQMLDAVPELPYLNAGEGAGERKLSYVQAGKAAVERELPNVHGGEVAVRRELLAVFAARTTRDPHFFDAGTLGEQLLTAFLRDMLPDSGARGIFQAEEKAALYYEAGLLRDALSNDVLVYGIRALDAGGRIHEGIEGFAARHEPVRLTLMTLGNLKKVLTAGEKIVYIVENPAVFSTLIGAWREDVIVCGNGQMRLAALVLLDLFDCDTHFFYAGDFDPEGLVIAQRLHRRYEGRVHMWNYCREYYNKYKSDIVLPENRLRKLEKIDLEELSEIKEALLEEKRAAYQEAMLAEYLTGKPAGYSSLH